MIWYDMMWCDVMWYDMIWYNMIYDIWHMTYDIWYMMYDMWYVIYDIPYMIYDIWYMIYHIISYHTISHHIISYVRQTEYWTWYQYFYKLFYVCQVPCHDYTFYVVSFPPLKSLARGTFYDLPSSPPPAPHDVVQMLLPALYFFWKLAFFCWLSI